MSDLASLTAQRDGLLKKLREIEGSGNDVETILEAIKNQRWYFFKNKQKVFMDRNTGILWANLDYYPYDVEYSNEREIKMAISKFAVICGRYASPWYLPCQRVCHHSPGGHRLSLWQNGREGHVRLCGKSEHGL